MVFCVGPGGVAVREGAVEGVGEETGNLTLGQSDGGWFVVLQQRDGLDTQTQTITLMATGQ